MAINIVEDIKPISYVETNAVAMMDYVNERRNPIVITQNGEAKAVLLDIETYQKTQDAFALLNLIQIGEQDIMAGKEKNVDAVFSKLEKKLTAYA